MTDDEMEERSEFFLKRQAQFASDLHNVTSDMQKVSSGLQKVIESQLRTEEALGTVVGLVGQIAATQLQMVEGTETDRLNCCGNE
ncbi:MAG: hypothetical protein QOD75_3747 [Blastocatellia bacterium]|jgi:hypothetical protein|nr:hypothetical protein [Blastocatellia bacterium]